MTNDVAPPTPTPIPVCRLTAAKNCKSKNAPGCTLTGSIGLGDGTPVVTTVRLERAPQKSARKWKLVKKGKTTAVGALGRWSRTVPRALKTYYRMRSTSPACTTKPLLVKAASK